MASAQIIDLPARAESATAHMPPATATSIRRAVESTDLDDLVAVGLALHLFTEIVGRYLELSVTDLHRSTTVFTKQINEALVRHSEHDALRNVLRLATDADRTAHPDGRTAAELCGEAWVSVRADAYARAEQSIQGADDFGVVPMLRLAATRAIVHQSPWWGTTTWRSRLSEYLTSNATTPVEHLTLGSAPEFAPESSLQAIVA
jgi:hypothetical protein